MAQHRFARARQEPLVEGLVRHWVEAIPLMPTKRTVVGFGASKALTITDTAFCRDFPFRALFSRLDINHVIYLVRFSLRLFDIFFDSIPDELQLKERYVLVG